MGNFKFNDKRGRPTKKDKKQKKLTFHNPPSSEDNNTGSSTFIENIHNTSSHTEQLSAMASTRTEATFSIEEEQATTTNGADEQVSLGEKILDMLSPPANEETTENVLDEIDANDDDNSEDCENEEGIEDIFSSNQQATQKMSSDFEDQQHSDNNSDERIMNDQNDSSGSKSKPGAIQQYLSKVQARIISQKYPAKYNRGTFWVYPKDAFFALIEDLEPNVLYYPRIFLWLPHFLMEKLEENMKLKCPKCKKELKSKGYTEKPRRVVDVTE